MFKIVPKPKPANIWSPFADIVSNTIESVPYDIKITGKRLCVADSETDPFLHGRVVKPFTFGFYDGETYVDFWGDDCAAQFVSYLMRRADENPEEELLIYVHNGGNFDFYFLLEFMDSASQPFIINGRLARIMIAGQEFRDSYSLIPVALGTYNKTPIDYSKFEREVREDHKEEIRAYQKDDCLYLFDLVREAQVMFGDKLTMASVALPMLRSFHGFETVSDKVDTEMRPFYFGGRNQCFEVGELQDDWKIYDVNSMYPYVMANMLHPVSATPQYERYITDRTHFAKIRAYSQGALPIRGPDGSLSFPEGVNDFFACIHEIKAGLETGLLRIQHVYYTVYYDKLTSFKEFIDTYYNMRLEAKANDDAIRTLFYKLVMNSSYGKFAQDPRKYENYLFDPEEMPTPIRCNKCAELEAKEGPDYEQCENCIEGKTSSSGWYIHTVRDSKAIYARPSTRLNKFGFYNVATAASITSGARAVLLRGISQAERPIYVDTDSIICKSLNARLGDKELGAWKLEAEGDTCCIAGKKLYAVFNKGEPIKSASKGVRLTADEIRRVSAGETIEYRHDVPKFKLGGEVQFTARRINRTGEASL